MIDNLNIFAGIVALTAALLAGLISLVNMLIAKDQKITEFRQKWIDDLRNDISLFVAKISFVADRTQDEFEKEKGEKKIFEINQLNIGLSILEAKEALEKIKLKLNPDEDDHKNLQENLSAMIKHMNDDETSGDKLGDSIDNFVAEVNIISRKILKSEWERVKEGEPRYKHANALIFIISAFIFVFLFSIILSAADSNPKCNTRGFSE